jgi:hypothetical protein
LEAPEYPVLESKESGTNCESILDKDEIAELD